MKGGTLLLDPIHQLSEIAHMHDQPFPVCFILYSQFVSLFSQNYWFGVIPLDKEILMSCIHVIISIAIFRDDPDLIRTWQ